MASAHCAYMKVTFVLPDQPWGELLEGLADLEDRPKPNDQAMASLKAVLRAREAEIRHHLEGKLVETAA